jgi:hypothetical protein
MWTLVLSIAVALSCSPHGQESLKSCDVVPGYGGMTIETLVTQAGTFLDETECKQALDDLKAKNTALRKTDGICVGRPVD